jgi:Arc/MetJ-type ribon-helix-helix transcriptional regulator
MVKTKNTIKVKYDSIKIPEALGKEIDNFIIKSGGLYISRADVVKHALRMLFGRFYLKKGVKEAVKELIREGVLNKR